MPAKTKKKLDKPKRITIPDKTRFELLEKQNNKCSNNPDNSAIGLYFYKCPMWILYDGIFDESRYQVDHIDEHCVTRNNHISNLQLLCPCCHSYKTKKWYENKGKQKKYTTREIVQGYAPMVDVEPAKKRKLKQ